MSDSTADDLIERPPLAGARRDLDEARRTLTAWLEQRLNGAADVELSAVAAPASNGVNNETLLFSASWREAGGSRSARCVARIEAAESLFLETRFAEQYRVIETLDRSGIVPVPQPVAYEPDCSWFGAPFFVLDHVDGHVPSDEPPYNGTGWLADATPDQRRQLWYNAVEVLGRLHQLDPGAVAFLDRPDRGATGLEQDLSYQLQSARWVGQHGSLPVVDAAGEWLVANLPSRRPTAFSWGDARYGNMIFDDVRCAAVLDWDMVSLAGGEADLAWWILFDHVSSAGRGLPRLPGLGTAEETVELWEKVSGQRAADLDWYMVYAAFRMCLAVTRAAQLLARSGLLPPGSEMETNNVGTQYLVSMLDLPAPGPVAVRWPGLAR